MEYVNFKATEDGNIVIADNIKRGEEIHLDKLEKQITDLQEQIDYEPQAVDLTGCLNKKEIEAYLAEFTLPEANIAHLEELKIEKEILLAQCQAAH